MPCITTVHEEERKSQVRQLYDSIQEQIDFCLAFLTTHPVSALAPNRDLLLRRHQLCTTDAETSCESDSLAHSGLTRRLLSLLCLSFFLVGSKST